MLAQPSLDLGMLVRGVVVQNQVEVAACRRLCVNELEEFEPLLVAVTVLALADDRARFFL